ncbi:MAG: FkbM family methyltransferase [Bacteroidetes bacterium]|nr:FkbM family methyltransferase [Bacteroidota bacterium]
MAITEKIRIKLNAIKNFYLFQKAGLPTIQYDKISKSVLKKYLPANPVTIDCGAHDGTDSVELSRIIGGTIHAFEPVSEIFQRLKKNTVAYKSIHCYQFALSDNNGVGLFYVSEGNSDASSSLLEPKEHLVDHPDTRFNKKIEVPMLTLDDWAKQNNISKIDMLWLDMQGFELNMLKASQKMLSTVKVIHTEVSLKETYKDVPQYQEYRTFLESKGFYLVVEAIPSGWDMGNALFARK